MNAIFKNNYNYNYEVCNECNSYYIIKQIYEKMFYDTKHFHFLLEIVAKNLFSLNSPKTCIQHLDGSRSNFNVHIHNNNEEELLLVFVFSGKYSSDDELISSNSHSITFVDAYKLVSIGCKQLEEQFAEVLTNVQITSAFNEINYIS
jgi:hypothetical protein